MTKDMGASVPDQALAVPVEPASGLAPTGFDPSRVSLGLYRVVWASGGESLAAVGMDEAGSRWIAPTNWTRPGMLTGDGWGAVERLIPLGEFADLQRGLEHACAALREVGDDYPGSSCCEWCYAKADEAEEIAAGGGT